MRNRLKLEKEKMGKIEESSPRFTDQEMAMLKKVRKEVGAKISDAMFKRSEMEKGLADAHEEARRMVSPCVDLSDEELAFAKACDVAIDPNKRVSRKSAEKMWKIASRILEETSNTESLRKG